MFQRVFVRRKTHITRYLTAIRLKCKNPSMNGTYPKNTLPKKDADKRLGHQSKHEKLTH